MGDCKKKVDKARESEWNGGNVVMKRSKIVNFHVQKLHKAQR